jgi:hypothetical protein
VAVGRLLVRLFLGDGVVVRLLKRGAIAQLPDETPILEGPALLLLNPGSLSAAVVMRLVALLPHIATILNPPAPKTVVPVTTHIAVVMEWELLLGFGVVAIAAPLVRILLFHVIAVHLVCVLLLHVTDTGDVERSKSLG